MTSHFCYFMLSRCSPGFYSTSVSQDGEWISSLNDIVIEPYELKAILLIGIGLLVWRLRGRLSFFTNRMKDLSFEILFLFLKTVIVFFRLIGSQMIISFFFIGLFFGFYLIKNAPDPKRKNYLLQSQSTVSVKQIKELDKKIQKTMTRNLLREMLGMKSRPEDEALLALAGMDSTTKNNFQKVLSYNASRTQNIVMMLLKMQYDAGYQSDLKGAYLHKIDLSRRILRAHNLEGFLQGTDFSSSVLIGSKFKNTNLSGAIFSNAELMHTHFIDCELINANFEGANLQSAIFSGSRLQGAQLSRTNLLQTFFNGAYLNGAIVDSPVWIENYHSLNRYSRVFNIRWHSLVKAKDSQGNSVYLFQGDDPPIKARKP